MQKPAVECVAKILSYPMMLSCHANGKKHEKKKGIVLDQETVQTSVSSSQDTERTIGLMLNDSARWKSEIT